MHQPSEGEQQEHGPAEEQVDSVHSHTLKQTWFHLQRSPTMHAKRGNYFLSLYHIPATAFLRCKHLNDNVFVRKTDLYSLYIGFLN